MATPKHNTRRSKSVSAHKNKVPTISMMKDSKDICPVCGNSVKSNENGFVAMIIVNNGGMQNVMG